MKVKITTLIDNRPGENANLKFEHGLSFYITVNGINYLFDTGCGSNYLYNADKMSIPINLVENVIISHGHHDHSNGLQLLFERTIPKQVLLPNDFFIQKYSKEKDSLKYNGANITEENFKELKINYRLINNNITELQKDVYIITNFSQNTSFETVDDRFVKRQDGRLVKDIFDTELVFTIKTDLGLIIITGCSHIGIINIISKVCDLMGENKILFLAGGIHLMAASRSLINDTYENLWRRNVMNIGVSHCTGDEACSFLKNKYKDNYIYMGSGSTYNYNS